MQLNDKQINEFMNIARELRVMEEITEYVATEWMEEDSEVKSKWCKYCYRIQYTNNPTHSADCIHLKAKAIWEGDRATTNTK